LNNPTFFVISAILIGIGATLAFDLGSLFLKYAFKMTPSNICLVGRWLLYIPQGILVHSSILSSPPKRAECATGWVAHYMIGITFAITFLAIVGNNWLVHPTPTPAIVFGIVTVLAPLLIMQPSFGFGFAASNSSNPTQARIRSLLNHTAFGAGLYLFALLVNRLPGIHA
jgi:hypothetical protein